MMIDHFRPRPGCSRAEESRRIWKSRGKSQEGWTKDTLENYKLNMAGDSEDIDPDPSNSSTDIFQVCVPANTNPYQDTSASTTYLGHQAGNTNMVEDILVGRSGAGEKENLYMKNDDVDRQTEVVMAVKEDVGEDTPPCLSPGWGSLLPPATTHHKQKASVQLRPWTEERQTEIGMDGVSITTSFCLHFSTLDYSQAPRLFKDLLHHQDCLPSPHSD